MAPKVRQWLRVTRAASSIPELWHREVHMDFLPAKGEMIFMWHDLEPDDDLPLRGALAVVDRRLFAADGRAEIWFENLDGDPIGRALISNLQRGGWKR